MPATIIGNPAVVTGLYQAFNGKAAGYNTYVNNLAYAAQNGPAAYAVEIGKGFANVPAATLAASVLTNIGIANATLQDALVQIFTAYPVSARGQIVLNLINLLTNLEGDATYGAAATSWNQLVGSNNAYSNNPTNVADSVVNAQAVTLTAGADVLTANIFNAARGYTPGGTDSVNTLNDDDVLTGSGTNPTLNFTYANDADTADYNIMPTLRGIETVNVAFATNAAAAPVLDLQDSTGINAVNVTRMSDTVIGPAIRNMTSVPANLSIANSSNNTATTVNFTFAPNAAVGAADVTTLTLNNVNLAGVNIDDQNVVAGVGVETINIVSSGAANRVALLTIEDTETLNISGSQNLTIGGEALAAGSLRTVNASALTANLDFTVSAGIMGAVPDGATLGSVAFALTSGTGADTIRISDQVQANDTINTGDGVDTLAMTNSIAFTNFIAANATAQVTNVEAIAVTQTAVAGISQVDLAQASGDQTTRLTNAAGNNLATFNLANATAAEATGVTIVHGTDVAGVAGNAIGENTINLDVGAGVTTVAVSIADGVNSENRFNFVLNADSDLMFNATTGAITSGAANTTNTVANVTINDNDTESNTVALAEAARHTGTITLSGGAAGTFLNLDTTTAGVNGGLYGYDVSGASAGDASTFVADHSGTGGQARLVASTINAAAEASNVVVRVSTSAAASGAQSITMGSGNDTVIFDNLNDNRAGLTISDAVVGGEGTDTLVIDGNVVGGTIALSASEWTNVSGFENIRLVNAGAGSNYSLVLTDALIAANKDAAGFLNIINDHDSVNDTANAADVVNGVANSESAVTIDARTLSANSRFTYNGEEGVSATNDRFILSDANINGGNVINGGAANNISTAGNNVANGDVLEVRNAAVVTVGDLANVSNVGQISFNNDLAIAQTLNLQLNDDVVDAMVDSFHASTLVNPERLTVIARDGTIASVAGAALVIDASAATGRSVLTITSDAGLLTAVADTITVASIVGNTAAHNIDIADGAGTADTLTFVGAAGEAFAATTTVAVAGTANTANLVIQNAAGLATVTHTVQWDNVDTINLNAGGVTTSFAAAAVNATFNGSAGADTIIGTAGANTINAGTGADTVTGGAGVDTIDLGADAVADLISFTGVNAAANRDVVTSFTVGTDVLGLDVDFTTAATAAGAAAAFEDEAAAAANANGAAYDIGALTAGNTNALDLVTLDVATLTNTANANLALATNGTELLKALVAAGVGNTASGIQMDNVGDSIYIATSQGGNGYLYLASAGADNLATANEIVLVGTFTGSLLDSVVAAQTLMVA